MPRYLAVTAGLRFRFDDGSGNLVAEAAPIDFDFSGPSVSVSAIGAAGSMSRYITTPGAETGPFWSEGLGLGIGLAETLTNDLMLSSVPPNKAGAASAISETAYEVGAVLGTAILGSVLTSTYRSHLTVPAVARWGENDSSFESLGGTVQYAEFYPNAVGERILASAHAAFDLGVQRTSAVAIVIALAAACVAWRTLKDA